MRVKIKLKSLDGSALFLKKKEAARAITNAFYSLLNSGGAEYGRWVHEEGWKTLRGTPVKLFSYSRLYCPSVIFDESGVYYMNDSVSFQAASPVTEVIATLVKGAMTGPPVKLGDKLFEVIAVDRVPEPRIGDSVRVKTLSPVQVTAAVNNLANGEPLHLTAEDKDFTARLERVTFKKWVAYLGKEPETFDFNVIPLNTRSTRVFHEGAGRYFPVTHGSFELKGSPELLKFVVAAGLGQRTGSGFGCLEVSGR